MKQQWTENWSLRNSSRNLAYDLNQSRESESTPNAFNFFSRMAWFTVSNTFFRSRYITPCCSGDCHKTLTGRGTWISSCSGNCSNQWINWFSAVILENLLFDLGSTNTSSPEGHIAFESICPIVEKCLFSASAISLGWRRNVFLTLIALTSVQFFDGSVCLRAFHILLLSDLFSSIKLRNVQQFSAFLNSFHIRSRNRGMLHEH